MNPVERSSHRLAMLVVLSGGALLSTATTVGLAPFLLDIARDLRTDLGAASKLVAIQSVSWGIASLFAGAASDRLGRRPLLVGGLLALVLSGIGVVASADYAWVAAWRFVGGLGGGAFMGTVFATVSDYFPSAKRGRSLGWVVTGQSLALVPGVPAMTLAGTLSGWRGAVLVCALTVLACTAAVWLVVPSASKRAVGRPVPIGGVARLVGPRSWGCCWPAPPSACATPPWRSFCRPICSRATPSMPRSWRPALLSVLSGVSNEARAAVLGLNITFSSLGWLGATALGGAIVGAAGFGGLAVLTFGFGLVGSLLCLATWLVPSGRMRLVVAPGDR